MRTSPRTTSPEQMSAPSATITPSTSRRIIALIVLLSLCCVVLLATPSVLALSATVHIPEKYADVHAGERLYFEVDIKYPENPERKDLRINYEIMENGEAIAQAKVLKAVETQTSFIDFIIIPPGARKGMHSINVKITDYEDLNEEVVASFIVQDDPATEFKFYFVILLGAIVLVGILVCATIWLSRKSAATQGTATQNAAAQNAAAQNAAAQTNVRQPSAETQPTNAILQKKRTEMDK